MQTSGRRLWGWIGSLLLVLMGGEAVAQSLAQLQFDIVGLKLVVDPAVLTVPKDLPTFVNTQLMLPGGVGPEAQTALQELTQDAAVLAELRGPELTPTTLAALPGQPLNLPPLHLPGDYFLDNIRLVKHGAVLLAGTPAVVPIRVISDVLISSVTTRELSLDEIRQKGIIIDESSFRALEFQAAFVIDGLPTKITFPVLVPRAPGVSVPGRTPGDLTTAINVALEQQQHLPNVTLPPELDRPGLNLYLVGAQFVPVAPSDATELTLTIPPINALVAIVGNIGFLDQIFAATVMVQNGAPSGSNLVVRNVRAAFTLPKGADQTAGTATMPGDDPLVFARTAQGVQSVVPILQPGLDEQSGTADDRDFLRPQESGTGEALLQGRLEGTHVFDVELSAVLEGLPSGAVQLKGVAKGEVQVRNPTFALALSHPRTIRTGEPYDLFATLTNTSDHTVNLVRVQLDQRAVSGATLLSDPVVQFDTLAAGESATALFHLLAERTGDVTFSQITTAPGLTANFTLRTGVDERGVPLSPNALVLPKQVDRLPSNLVMASQRVLGQAFSVATAPQLPPGVRYIPRRVVTQRGQELAEVGLRLAFNEPLVHGISDLLLDWLGNSLSDPGFEQLLRTTTAGTAWADAVGAVLQDQLGTGTVLDLQHTVADTGVSRAPHLSVVVGNGTGVAPVRLRLSDTFGQRTGLGLNETTVAHAIPFAHLFTLAAQGDSRSQLAVVAKLNATVYTVEVFGTGSGTTALGVVLPLAGGKLVQVTYENLAVVQGSHFLLLVDTQNPGSLALQIDADGDGVFETLQPPHHTTELSDRAPQVVAARSLTDLSEAFVYNSALAHMGLLVDVLFNKTVTQASAEAPAHYAIANNAVQSAILQPTGRVATLLLQRPIGALIPRDLTVSGLADNQGQISSAQTVPIQGLLNDGARLIGQVRRADGRPVPQAFVRLGAFVNLPPHPQVYILGLIRADSNGYFDFDFVRRTLSPFFMVTATDPVSGEEVSLQSRVRFDGDTLVVNPIFFGRGRVVGAIVLPDGVTPAGIAAVNLFPDFARTGESGSGVYANTQGVFSFENVPVGNFTIRAERVELQLDAGGVPRPFATGEFATVTGVVRESGETVTVPIVLTTRPMAAPGRLRGRVFLSDGSTPAVHVPVFVGSLSTLVNPPILSPLAQSETDATGSFEFNDLPPETLDVVAVDPTTRQFASAAVTVLADQLVGINVFFGSTGMVHGIVRDASGNLVRNSGLVACSFTLVSTDSNGQFTCPEVSLGVQNIAAGNVDTKRTGTASITVFPGQTNEIEVRLQAVADITGCVTDAQGQRVQGALIRIPIPGAGYFKASTDANGCYVFPNMGLGDYTVSATGHNVQAPLSPDEVATQLRDDFNQALDSQNLAAIQAAFKQAIEVFVGTSNLLFQQPPAATPGNFGFTKVRSFQDGVAAFANITYMPTGRVAGVTMDGNGLPTRASMQIQGLKLDDFGAPVFGNLGLFSSDTVSGQFLVPAVTYGDYLLSAARPFSPVILSQRGALSATHPNDDNLVLQFPAAMQTNGSITGTVFLPDGVTPVAAGVEVQVSFGGLTVTTDPQGRFYSPVPIPAGRYTVTATDPVTTLAGRVSVQVAPGGTIDVPIRLLGRTSVVVMVQRPDGVPVPGASVIVQQQVFPQAMASGVTGSDGTVVLTNLPEGTYGVLAMSTDQRVGRAGLMIAQADAVLQRQVGSVVTVRGFGTITGMFLRPDGVTSIANAQISLFVEGVSVTQAGLSAALTTTDGQGRFTYDLVPLGAFRVLALDPTSLRLGETSGRLLHQNDTVHLTVTTGALGRISGQVRSADGLMAIAGATVSVSPTRLPGPGDPFPRITAGIDGTFTYDGVPAGPFTVRVTDPVSGFSGQASGSITGEGQTTSVEVRLEGFGTLSGQVFDIDGSIVTNAEVTLRSPDTATIGRKSAVDGAGRFTFTFLPLVHYELRAQRQDPLQQRNGGIAVAQLTAHGQTLDVPITLRGVGTVQVTVLEADGITPIPSADVTLRSKTPFGGGAPVMVFTDAQGTVPIPDVPVGAFDVSVQSSTLRVAGTASGTLVSAGQTLPIQVVLGPAGTLKGRLALPDANATPVPGAFVTLTFAAQTAFGGTLQVLSNALGEFVFDNIPVGPVTLDIFEPVSGGLRKLTSQISQNEQVVDFGVIILDLDAPHVVATVPAEGATGVAVQPTITLTFNEPIDPASVQFDNSGLATATAGNLLLVDSQQHKLQADTTVSGDGLTVFITPRQPLASETRYQVVVRNGTNAVRDLAAGRTVQSPFILSFTSVDAIPPTLVSQTPAPGATGILSDAVLRLTFSEAMAPTLNLSLTHNGQSVAGTVALLFGGTVAVFTPAQPLALNATYQYALSSATDLAGNGLVGGTLTASFATLDTQGPTVVALPLAGTPSHIAGTSVTVVPTILETDTASVEYAVNDVPTQTVTSTPFAFTLPLPVGQSQVHITATAIDTSGNRGAARPQDIAILPNQRPTVTLTNLSGATSVLPGQTLSFSVVASDDVALMEVVSSVVFSTVGVASQSHTDTVAGGQTQFVSTFTVMIPPTVIANSSVTVQAVARDSLGTLSLPDTLTLPVRDGVKPTVTITSPVHNAQVLPGQQVDVVITACDDVAVASFSLACAPALAGCGTQAVAPATACRTPIFPVQIPATLVAPATVTLMASAVDTAGNSSVQASRTLQIADTVAPMLTTLHTLSGSTRVLAGQNVTVEAQASDNVAVTAVDFRTLGMLITPLQTVPVPSPAPVATAPFTFTVPTTAANGGTITVLARARDASQSSAEVSLTLDIGDTMSPTVTILSPPANSTVTPGQSVILTLQAVDDVAVAQVSLSVSGVVTSSDVRVLTPPVTPASVSFTVPVPPGTPPGPIMLSVTARDTAGHDSAVASQSVSVLDNVAPSVQITSPGANAQVDPRSLSVTIAATDNTGVSEVILVASGAMSVVDTRPISPTAASTVQTFTLPFSTLPATGGSLTFHATASDLAGNQGVASPVTVSVRDVVPPQVTQVTPPQGATGVDPNTVVRVQFSEPIDRSTVTATTLRLRVAGTAIPVTLAFSNGDRSVTLTPVMQPLPFNKVVSIEVGTSITDLAGNALAAAVTTTFTTASPDLTAPRVASVAPANGATDVSIATPIQVTFSESLDPATVDQTSWTVRDGAIPITGSLRFISDNTIVQFTPTAPLPFGTLITLQLTAAITDVFGNPLADASGNPLTQPLTFTFTTGTFSITNPADGSDVVELASLLLEARGSAALHIATVTFSVNGQTLPSVSGPSFTTLFTTPAAGATLTITATARSSSGTQIAQAQVNASVVAGLRLKPSLVGIPLGAQSMIRLLLSSPPTTDVPVDLSAVHPGVVDFPMPQVVLPAGQTDVAVPLTGVAAGSTTVLATSSHGTAAAIVSVDTPVTQHPLTTLMAAVGTVALSPPSLTPVIVSAGGQQTVPVRVLTSPAPMDLTVTVASNNPTVAQVVGAVVIPKNGQTAPLTLVTGGAGEAVLTLQTGTQIRQLTVFVGTPPPGRLPLIVTAPGGVAVLSSGTAGTLFLDINGSRAIVLQLLPVSAITDTTIEVSSAQPQIADITPANSTLPAGQQDAVFTVHTGMNAAEVLVTLRIGTEVRTLLVVVGSPAPAHRPLTVAPIVGTR